MLTDSTNQTNPTNIEPRLLGAKRQEKKTMPKDQNIKLNPNPIYQSDILKPMDQRVFHDHKRFL